MAVRTAVSDEAAQSRFYSRVVPVDLADRRPARCAGPGRRRTSSGNTPTPQRCCARPSWSRTIGKSSRSRSTNGRMRAAFSWRLTRDHLDARARPACRAGATATASRPRTARTRSPRNSRRPCGPRNRAEASSRAVESRAAQRGVGAARPAACQPPARARRHRRPRQRCDKPTRMSDGDAMVDDPAIIARFERYQASAIRAMCHCPSTDDRRATVVARSRGRAARARGRPACARPRPSRRSTSTTRSAARCSARSASCPSTTRRAPSARSSKRAPRRHRARRRHRASSSSTSAPATAARR